MSEIKRDDWEHDMNVFKEQIIRPINEKFEAVPGVENWHTWIQEAGYQFDTAKNDQTLNIKDERSFNIVEIVLTGLEQDFGVCTQVEDWHLAEAYVIRHFGYVENLLRL